VEEAFLNSAIAAGGMLVGGPVGAVLATRLFGSFQELAGIDMHAPTEHQEHNTPDQEVASGTTTAERPEEEVVVEEAAAAAEEEEEVIFLGHRAPPEWAQVRITNAMVSGQCFR
jgi:hypothetical protein